jgi:tetratricopeptide (TPR) repeat protein
MNNLALAYQGARKLALAVPLLEETLKLRKARFGPQHPSTLTSMNNLAAAYRDARKLDLALPLYEETLQLTKARLGLEHPSTLRCMNNLALAYTDAEMRDRALPLQEETWKLQKARLGADHPDTLTSMNNLALAYLDAGKPDRARTLLVETLKLMEARLGPGHPDTLTCLRNLKFLRGLGAAQERYREKLAEFGPDYIDTLLARRDLAQAYMRQNRLDEAERILAEVLEGMKTRATDDPIRVFTIGLLRHCLMAREKIMPDAWRTFHAKSLLGGALLGQKKYADAEPLLLAGYAGMKKREAQIPPQGKVRLTEAVERLVRFYEATDRKADAAKWRQTLETLQTAQKKVEKQP